MKNLVYYTKEEKKSERRKTIQCRVAIDLKQLKLSIGFNETNKTKQ